MNRKIKAFTLLEFSIVILIIGLLVGATILGAHLIKSSRLKSAQSLTQSSIVASTPGLSIWLEASLDRSLNQSITNLVADASPLAVWYDSNPASNNKLNATQNTDINKPIYSDINYIPALKFDGTNSYMTFDGSFLNNSDYTIFVVEKRSSNKDDNYFFGDNSVTTTNQSLVLGYSKDNQVIHKQGTSNSYQGAIGSYGTYKKQPRIFTFTQDIDDGKKTIVNGMLMGQSADTSQLSNIGTVKIGNAYQGNIAEIIIFNRRLSNTEIKDIQGNYLAKKYNVKYDSTSASSSSFTDCTGGTETNGTCNTTVCSVSISGISATQVNGGSGSLNCSSGYSGGPVTYTCNSGVLNTSGSCSAITCTITSQTGYNDKTGLAYAASATAIPATACATGYSGSGTYVCTSAGAATSLAGCSPITCTITSQTGYNNKTGLAYAASATAIPATSCATGYTGSGTYVCTSTGAATSLTGCSAITCSITSQTGLSNQTGLAYSSSPVSLSCNSGYTGSPTYTCTSTGAANISGSCTAITCSITSVTGLTNQTGLAYSTSPVSLSCNSGYTGSPTYTCTSTGAASISGSCTASGCGNSNNGAGGTFNGTGLTNNSQYAQNACESYYGSGNCTIGNCGSFSYWYQSGAMSCNCSKPAGSYEWVYSNFGNSYSIVGHDYGGQNTSILNKLPFVRQKGSNTCDSNSWVLNLGNMASGCPGITP